MHIFHYNCDSFGGFDVHVMFVENIYRKFTRIAFESSFDDEFPDYIVKQFFDCLIS